MLDNESNNNEWKTQILQQLDYFAQEYDFPMLDNIYNENADIRLTTFRSSTEWLLVFEEIALYKEHLFVNSLSAFGNKIIDSGIHEGIDNIISEVPGVPIWDESNKFLLSKWDFELVINGQEVKLTPTIEDYKNAGIEVNNTVSDPLKILRLLTFLMPEKFFLTDSEILKICGRENSGLKIFIQLHSWYHPNIANDELPSDSVCFQSLAEAVSKNDKSLYSCPESMNNTHWSNWNQKLT